VFSESDNQLRRCACVIVGTACLYYLGGYLGLLYPFVDKSVTLIWPPTGVAFAAVWRFGPLAIAGIIPAAFLVCLAIGASWSFSMLVALGNALPAYIGWRLLSHWKRRDLFDDPVQLVRFIGIAVLLAPVASASVGTLANWISQASSPITLFQTWLVWWGGDAAGVLVVAPALLSWVSVPTISRSPWKWAEFALMGVFFSVLSHYLFFSPENLLIAPLSFAVLPLIVWAALRFPPFVLYQMLLAIASVAVFATANGRGPFAVEGFHQSFIFLHSFLAAIASVGLILCASVHSLRRSIDRANANGQRRAKQQSTMLSLIDEELLFQAPLDRVLSKLTEMAAATMGVQRVGFWRLSEDGEALTSVDCFDTATGEHGNGTELQRSLYPSYFSALHGKQMVVAENARAHAETKEFTRSYLEPLGIGAMLDVPVRLFGNLIGVLCFEHVGPPRHWQDDERFFALSMANLVAAAHEHDERRRAEAALQLAVTAFETSEGIMITDAHSNILRANQAACVITGYDADALVGSNTRMLHSDRHEPEFYEAMWKELLEEGHWEGETWARRRDGTVYPQWISTNVVRDHGGAISHYVSTFIDISERKQAEQEIAHLAYFDSLTGLPNRRLVMDRLQQAFLTAQRAKRNGILMFVDLDHFKHLNDALGHSAGDELLIEAAGRLCSLGRQTDSIGRWGGDEFLVLMDSLCESVEAAVMEAQLVADKILAELSRPFVVAGQVYQLGASIGVAVFPDGCADAIDVLKQADTAMYRAKAHSRNAVRFFEAEMQHIAERRLDIEQSLREALRREELQIFLQPQISPDGHRHAAEVLTRWNRQGHGWIDPEVFIPVAEESGLICELGDWVLGKACRVIHDLERSGMGCDIAVNVSPRQFRQPDFVNKVWHALRIHDAPSSRLVLELTEGAVIDDLNEAIAKMSELGQLGVRFSIDDFGTGYCSLTYLRRLPVSEIKIDRSFVHDIASDPNDAAIVDAIIAMAGRLDVKVVAEGVESAEQQQFLEARGCQYFQGFYYSRPLAWPEFLGQFGGAPTLTN
jgi:diguanylate cyclase (GGDEF)-like protein/PAS domain S-box-containing protein